jgi:hypothetical protein
MRAAKMRFDPAAPCNRGEADMMTRLLFASALFTGAAMVWAPEAGAAGICGNRAVIVAKLEDQLGETRMDGAAASPSAFYEFYASETTRTWTILLSGINGASCVVATGRDWQPREALRESSVVPARDGWPQPGALMVR